jgi:hypothetical protein
VVIGTLGHNRAIDGLVARGRLSVSGLAGAWESFVIATVDHPWPGVDQALVIVGSDRRGTAYGAYELARAIGVSPWAWWADLPPRHRDALWLEAGLHRFGPPSVKYRGIFLNDEDWGLYPWAAQTYDPAYGNIGPRTYQRVFELMLRLKANTLWPAMHKTTRAFNADPANARLADSYGIVMGSSHAEAMLRNNVGEWKDDPARFNYATNRAGVRAYWDERARINAGYESLWTVGLRGLHDTGMVGAPTMAARQALLDQAIADQRAILDAHVPGGAARAGQIFVPYKEVLDIYRAGIHVPDNVTIVWPDDNFGYIRQFPSPAEAARSGGAGVYYHLSYLGYPLAYLWLYTTPPALVQEEMLRAYDAGARQLWMVNVGDIKPAEIGISHFLDLAWDVERWRGTSQHAYLAQWLGAAFGPQAGEAGADLLDAHFRLNMVRRPEHLEWPAHEEDRHLSSLTPAQVDARLGEMRRIAARAEQVGQACRRTGAMPGSSWSAFRWARRRRPTCASLPPNALTNKWKSIPQRRAAPGCGGPGRGRHCGADPALQHRHCRGQMARDHARRAGGQPVADLSPASCGHACPAAAQLAAGLLPARGQRATGPARWPRPAPRSGRLALDRRDRPARRRPDGAGAGRDDGLHARSHCAGRRRARYPAAFCTGRCAQPASGGCAR